MNKRSLFVVAIAVVLGSTAGVIYRYHEDTKELQTRLDRTEAVARRTALRDVLMGRPLPHMRLNDLTGASRRLVRLGRRQAIWFVDVQRCPNCLEDAAPWERLRAQASDVEATLVLIGMDAEDARDAVRAKRIRSDVLIDVNVKVGSVVPLMLPSIYVLVDEGGVVTMADGRSAKLNCRWSFPGQLASLVGSGGSEWIRP